jgi:signal transduction histidine kinase
LFIATVSHELRTPMNAILGFNNLLMQQAQDKPQALKILQHTQQSAEHLLTVINDVLGFSQLQAGKINIHPETFLLPSHRRQCLQAYFCSDSKAHRLTSLVWSSQMLRNGLEPIGIVSCRCW